MPHTLNYAMIEYNELEHAVIVQVHPPHAPFSPSFTFFRLWPHVWSVLKAVSCYILWVSFSAKGLSTDGFVS